MFGICIELRISCRARRPFGEILGECTFGILILKGEIIIGRGKKELDEMMSWKCDLFEKIKNNNCAKLSSGYKSL